MGTRVTVAVDRLVAEGRTRVLTELLKTAAKAGADTDGVWGRVATPDLLARELARQPMDLQVVESLVARLKGGASDPLLDALAASNDRSARWNLLRLLGEIGAPAASAVVARLPDKPWFVQRNLLLLLGRLGTWPEGFSPTTYIAHGDPRVRREAYRLLLDAPGGREAAIVEGLSDPDPGIVTMVVGAALPTCPPAAIPPIDRIAHDTTRDTETRLLAVRALAGCPDPDRVVTPGEHRPTPSLVGRLPTGVPVSRPVRRAEGARGQFQRSPRRVGPARPGAAPPGPRDPRRRARTRAMSDPIRFLTGLTQALSAAVLDGEGHPAYRRAADAAYRQLQDLQRTEGMKLHFSFLDGEVVFRDRALHELRAWDWTPRLAEAGIQRIEVTGEPSPDEFEEFLDMLAARIAGKPFDSTSVRHEGSGHLRFGHVAVQRDHATTRRPRRSSPRSTTVSRRSAKRSTTCTTR